MSHLHQLQFTVAHTLGFSVSTSHFPATDLDAQTVSLTLQIFHVNLLVTETVFSTHADNSLWASMYELVLNWPTCTLLVLYSYSTGTARTLLLYYWSCTAFSLSYKHWNPTCGECSAMYCCAWRHWGYVVLPYCCAIHWLPRNLATRGAKRGEGRGGKTQQRSATLAQSRSLRFLNFSSSLMGRLRHSIYILL
jgi:hypothetical protein